MKVMLLNGSPHPAGCVYTALDEIARTLAAEGIDSEIFQIGVKPIRGCIACGKCRANGTPAGAGGCIFGDDVCNVFTAASRSSANAFSSASRSRVTSRKINNSSVRPSTSTGRA